MENYFKKSVFIILNFYLFPFLTKKIFWISEMLTHLFLQFLLENLINEIFNINFSVRSKIIKIIFLFSLLHWKFSVNIQLLRGAMTWCRPRIFYHFPAYLTFMLNSILCHHAVLKLHRIPIIFISAAGLIRRLLTVDHREPINDKQK